MLDFCLPRWKNYPEKVILFTFQTNINLHMFRDELEVKKGCLTSAGVFIFSRENLPCTRLSRRKFELTNQDSTSGKNLTVLTSM